MSQSRKASATESAINCALGIAFSFAIQYTLFPLMGWSPSFGENLTICAVFTAASLIRSYVLRRLFNWWHHRH